MIGTREWPVAMISSAIRLAWLIGIAKPSPMLPALAAGLPPERVAIAELTPITWRRRR